MHKLGLNQGGRSRSDASEVNAQLQHLRQQTSSNTTEKLRAAELTISEWNEGFFRPRGIHITSIDQNAETAAGVESSRKTSSRIPWQEPKSSRNSRRGFLRNPFIEAGPQGFRMGPIIVSQNVYPFISSKRWLTHSQQANNEGFRIGRSLVVGHSFIPLPIVFSTVYPLRKDREASMLHIFLGIPETIFAYLPISKINPVSFHVLVSAFYSNHDITNLCSN
jgi:hypothetical protein